MNIFFEVSGNCNGKSCTFAIPNSGMENTVEIVEFGTSSLNRWREAANIPWILLRGNKKIYRAQETDNSGKLMFTKDYKD